MKQLRLKCILLDNFIPPDVRVRLFGHVEFDENQDDWILPKNNKPDAIELARCVASCRRRSNGIRPADRRPLTDKHVNNDNNQLPIRYRFENVIDLELDRSRAITENYIKPEVHPKFPAMVAVHFSHESRNATIDVHEPPPSFQPRTFPRRDLEKRHEKASRLLIEFNAVDK